jgi:hypothetical protein
MLLRWDTKGMHTKFLRHIFLETVYLENREDDGDNFLTHLRKETEL